MCVCTGTFNPAVPHPLLVKTFAVAEPIALDALSGETSKCLDGVN